MTLSQAPSTPLLSRVLRDIGTSLPLLSHYSDASSVPNHLSSPRSLSSERGLTALVAYLVSNKRV